jgi:GPH family glycoside/pentoside/hexuronide:cation symporter
MISSIEYRPNKISIWQKACFGLVTSGSMIISHIITNGLLKYYTDMIGMSGQVYGIAWLFFAIYNTINDPIIGFISDKRKYSLKKGKRIFYIKRATPMIFLGLVIVTLVNPIWYEYLTLIILIIGLSIYDTGIAILNLNVQALKNVITDDTNERASISMVMMYINLIPGVMGGTLPYILTNDFSLEMVQFLFILYSSIGFLMSIIGGHFLKEPMHIYKDELERIKENKQNKEIAENMKTTDTDRKSKFSIKPFFAAFESRSFRYFAIANLIISIPISCYYGNIMYYFDDVMVAPDINLFGFVFSSGSMPYFLMGTAGLLMPLGYPIYLKLNKKVEHRKIVITGLTVCSISYIGLFFAQHFLVMAILYLFVMLGIGTYWLFSTIIFADIIDEYQLKTGERKDGIFLGMGSIIATPAFSIMTFIFGKTLDYYNYDGAALIQSSSAILGIRIANGLIPPIFLFIGILILYLYPLKGEYLKQVRRQFHELYSKNESKNESILDIKAKEKEECEILKT